MNLKLPVHVDYNVNLFLNNTLDLSKLPVVPMAFLFFYSLHQVQIALNWPSASSFWSQGKVASELENHLSLDLCSVFLTLVTDLD